MEVVQRQAQALSGGLGVGVAVKDVSPGRSSTCGLPARRGYRVAALVLDRDVVALFNLVTGGINFVRVDPPLRWRRSDAVFLILVGAVPLSAGVVQDRPEAIVSAL